MKMLRNRTVLVAIAGFAAAAAAIGLVVASQVGGDEKTTTTSIAVKDVEKISALLDGIPQSGNELGRTDAPVTLVEYADIQCPFCAQWALGAFPDLVRDYVRPGKLKIVFQGMAFLGPDSERTLRLALAAGEQNRMWHTLELLFANQGEENSGWAGEALLGSIAASVPGLDTEQALDARTSDPVTALLAEHLQFAAENGIQSTPSFQIGRTGGEVRLLEISSLDAAAMRPAIEELLAP